MQLPSGMRLLKKHSHSVVQRSLRVWSCHCPLQDTVSCAWVFSRRWSPHSPASDSDNAISPCHNFHYPFNFDPTPHSDLAVCSFSCSLLPYQDKHNHVCALKIVFTQKFSPQGFVTTASSNLLSTPFLPSHCCDWREPISWLHTCMNTRKKEEL